LTRLGLVLADADGALHVIASTSERATAVEERQLATRQGPCFDSYRSATTVEAVDLSESPERWADFAQFAQEPGFEAAFATPMTLRGQHPGCWILS